MLCVMHSWHFAETLGSHVGAARHEQSSPNDSHTISELPWVMQDWHVADLDVSHVGFVGAGVAQHVRPNDSHTARVLPCARQALHLGHWVAMGEVLVQEAQHSSRRCLPAILALRILRSVSQL